MPNLQSGAEESAQQFERRKTDHIRYSLEEKNEAIGLSGIDQVELIHEALPDLDFEDINISTQSLNLNLETPFLVSSMTAGHVGSLDLNHRLARACEKRGWLMGVGSQRRELYDVKASNEWKALRKDNPKVRLLGNLGLSQLIHTPIEDVQRLVDALEATAMIVHTNPLQECMQPEGTPQFKGGLKALKELSKQLSVPVILKETGCGFSKTTLERVKDLDLAAVDISGFGGTHWGRIEGSRNTKDQVRQKAAETFQNWGISTIESLVAALKVKPTYEVWASGGVRNGLHAATLLALGAQIVGLAKPILSAALKGEEDLELEMQRIEYELKTALFCTGCINLSELKSKNVIRNRKDS